MKFFDFEMAPNPRRARIFMAEKEISEVDIIQVDLGDNRENVGKEYRSINPSCTVPALVLDDGTLISESVAICRYHGKPMGMVGNRWNSMEILGNLWKSIAIYGNLWNSMETNRNPWKTEA